MIRALRGEFMVGTLHTTNGRWDIVAEVMRGEPGGLRQCPGPHPSDAGHCQYQTSILLSTYEGGWHVGRH